MIHCTEKDKRKMFFSLFVGFDFEVRRAWDLIQRIPLVRGVPSKS
jgi:hypothetical protein